MNGTQADDLLWLILVLLVIVILAGIAWRIFTRR